MFGYSQFDVLSQFYLLFQHARVEAEASGVLESHGSEASLGEDVFDPVEADIVVVDSARPGCSVAYDDAELRPRVVVGEGDGDEEE
jgi:hypothetical protein